MTFLERIQRDEPFRRDRFPTAAARIYMAHAGVAPLPRVATDAMREFLDHAAIDNPESEWAMGLVERARADAAKLIGAHANEIALLGPTSVGLSLVANGLEWSAGDEVVSYFDDYPANVYPWTQLASKGVKYVGLEPSAPGVITWELVEAALTGRTKLVALASCHFLSGYRIDIDTIGRNLGDRGVLFCVDAIQTVGAFPTPVEHVDFLSADSHKWMLGPPTAGIFYVKKSRLDLLRPTLVGAMNLHAPDFIAQEHPEPLEDARRFESGILNLPGIIGMQASMRMLLDIGIPNISKRLLELRSEILHRLRPLGYTLYLDQHDRDSRTTDETRSSILALTHPSKDLAALYESLKAQGVIVSHRLNRAGQSFLRLSPHFYNTVEEIERVVELLR